MSLSAIHMERFTAFHKLRVNFSPGLNVFVGGNGTGKTHLMKVAYAACDITKSEVGFAEKLIRVFMPSDRALGRLVKRQQGSARGAVEVYRDHQKLRVSFSNHTTVPESASVTGAKMWRARPIESVYVPVKEMLSNAPGFRLLYAQREIHFEEVYADILDRAYRPPLRGPIDQDRKTLLRALQQHMEGKVTVKNDEFFLRNKQGNLEFPLLAEGFRSLAYSGSSFRTARCLVDRSFSGMSPRQTSIPGYSVRSWRSLSNSIGAVCRFFSPHTIMSSSRSWTCSAIRETLSSSMLFTGMRKQRSCHAIPWTPTTRSIRMPLRRRSATFMTARSNAR